MVETGKVLIAKRLMKVSREGLGLRRGGDLTGKDKCFGSRKETKRV